MVIMGAGVVNDFDWNGLNCNRNIWEYTSIFDWFQSTDWTPAPMGNGMGFTVFWGMHSTLDPKFWTYIPLLTLLNFKKLISYLMCQFVANGSSLSKINHQKYLKRNQQCITQFWWRAYQTNSVLLFNLWAPWYCHSDSMGNLFHF